jgi:hypothetical protein
MSRVEFNTLKEEFDDFKERVTGNLDLLYSDSSFNTADYTRVEIFLAASRHAPHCERIWRRHRVWCSNYLGRVRRLDVEEDDPHDDVRVGAREDRVWQREYQDALFAGHQQQATRFRHEQIIEERVAIAALSSYVVTYKLC